MPEASTDIERLIQNGFTLTSIAKKKKIKLAALKKMLENGEISPRTERFTEQEMGSEVDS